MESGSECGEAKASSSTRKVELPTFDGNTERLTNSKSSILSDGDPLQFLKSGNRSKEGSVIKNHTSSLVVENKPKTMKQN